MHLLKKMDEQIRKVVAMSNECIDPQAEVVYLDKIVSELQDMADLDKSMKDKLESEFELL